MVDSDRNSILFRADEVLCFGTEFYQAVILRSEQAWIGDGTAGDIALNEIAISGTTELWMHGIRYTRKTTATEAVDIYEYEEILDSIGRVTAIRPREIIPTGSKCILFYVPAVIY